MASREEKKHETREKILSAAIHLILKKGVSNTSIKDITEQAGVAVGTFYLYFNSKEDVIKSIDRVIHKKLLEKVAAVENLSPIEKIYEYFLEWYKIGSKYDPGFIREWHCLNISAANGIEGYELQGGELEHMHVRELFNEAIEAGELDKNIPVDDVVRMLICGLWGTSIYLCTASKRKPREKIAADFIDYVVKPALNPYLVQ